MRIASFDIFDTCLLRKCGTPQNFFDVFSLHAFNGKVEECVRQEFVAARVLAEKSLSGRNPYYSLKDIWDTFSWNSLLLKSKSELCRLELELEREMLAPVLKMRDEVEKCRRQGDKIVFISDMYLSSSFLTEEMKKHGFYKDGDSLYVSCECNAIKHDGSLFQYIRDKENVSYRHWHHFGDNKQGDHNAPKELGIKATIIDHVYTSYQKMWLENDYSLGFKTPSVLAGIGRALHYSTEWTSHTDFVLDLIAPFYCSLVYRIMKDAENRGIKRLYFMARDACMMYQIARKFKSLFPEIDCRFLYISRKALYQDNDEAKIAYFESVGLATNDYVGVVDIRSTGRTLVFLNEYLASKGYRRVRGYYYELFIQMGEVQYCPEDYYTELSSRYNSSIGGKVGRFAHVFETMFSMNTLNRTIGYRINDTGPEPIFDSTVKNEALEEDEVIVKDKEYWTKIHEELLLQYSELFIRIGLYQFSDDVFRLANYSLLCFLSNPDKSYLSALECMYGRKSYGKDYLPYVKKESWLRLLYTHGKDTIWKQGTIKYNDFDKVHQLYRRCVYGKDA